MRVVGALAEAFLSLYLEQAEGDITPEQIASARELVTTILEGKIPKPVPRTEANQLISPVTGKPCPFLTTEGPTSLGYSILVMLRNALDGG